MGIDVMELNKQLLKQKVDAIKNENGKTSILVADLINTVEKIIEDPYRTSSEYLAEKGTNE